MRDHSFVLLALLFFIQSIAKFWDLSIVVVGLFGWVTGSIWGDGQEYELLEKNRWEGTGARTNLRRE